MGKRRVKREDHAVYKNNFWNQLRKERDVSFQYIGNILGCSATAVRYYFIGKSMPNTDYIKKLCEGFDVDLEQGTEEFKQMHKEWKHNHPSTGNKRLRTNIRTSDAFWHRKVRESNLTFKELADITNIPYSTIKQYFNGYAMPPTTTLSIFCNLFDVDYETGKSAFEDLMVDWESKHPDYVRCGNYHKRITDTGDIDAEATNDTPASVANSEIATLTTPTLTTPTINLDFLELLYGVLSCKDYNRVKDLYDQGGDTSGILRILYQKVDFDTFMSIVGVSVYG